VQQPPTITVTGTVVDVSDDVPVIATPQGQIQLNVRANLPIGTVVTLEVGAHQAPVAEAAIMRPTPSPAVPPLATPSTGWPTLSEALQVMQRADPQAALELAGVIPDGGPRTALAVMALVQALRSGEPRQWPGDTVLRAIEGTGPRGAHLAALLGDEVGELGRQVREPAGDWRSLPLPWHADGRVERIRLVLRETDPDENKRGRASGTRFLVDAELSRLGPLQLDGMMRKESRSFDMILRTVAALPDEMRRDLAGLFAATNAAMNLNGSLSFQVSRQFPDPAAVNGPVAKRGLWV
jgi:hypothetical protein